MTNDATSQAALRAEIRLLRDEGVYGSSMVPYLTVLRAIFDTTEDYVDQVDEEPEVGLFLFTHHVLRSRIS